MNYTEEREVLLNEYRKHPENFLEKYDLQRYRGAIATLIEEEWRLTTEAETRKKEMQSLRDQANEAGHKADEASGRAHYIRDFIFDLVNRKVVTTVETKDWILAGGKQK